MAFAELEQRALEHSLQAVKLDNQGQKDKALEHYQKAVELLKKLVEISPDYDLNKVYSQRAFSYQKRIELLKRVEIGDGESMEITDISSSSSSIVSRKREREIPAPQAQAEKPNVKWTEVIGLADVKRAIREAIVYPIQRPDLFPLG